MVEEKRIGYPENRHLHVHAGAFFRAGILQ